MKQQIKQKKQHVLLPLLLSALVLFTSCGNSSSSIVASTSIDSLIEDTIV